MHLYFRNLILLYDYMGTYHGKVAEYIRIETHGAESSAEIISQTDKNWPANRLHKASEERWTAYRPI